MLSACCICVRVVSMLYMCVRVVSMLYMCICVVSMLLSHLPTIPNVVKSPMDTLTPKPGGVDAAKGLSQRRNSVQTSSGGGAGMDPSLLAIMSTSAQTTGSQSTLRTVTVRKMKEELLKKLEILGPKLPANTLDELIDELGGPSHVAEVTGYWEVLGAHCLDDRGWHGNVYIRGLTW